jgi:hypothetical protein
MVCSPPGNMARKQCFLVCPPSGNMARKQCFLVCPPLGNMANLIRLFSLAWLQKDNFRSYGSFGQSRLCCGGCQLH